MAAAIVGFLLSEKTSSTRSGILLLVWRSWSHAGSGVGVTVRAVYLFLSTSPSRTGCGQQAQLCGTSSHDLCISTYNLQECPLQYPWKVIWVEHFSASRAILANLDIIRTEVIFTKLAAFTIICNSKYFKKFFPSYFIFWNKKLRKFGLTIFNETVLFWHPLKEI